MDFYPPGYSDPNLGNSYRDGPAWERRGEIGLISALFGTIKEVLFSPGPTFAQARLNDGLGSPLLFFVLVVTIFGTVSQIMSDLFMSSTGETLTSALESFPNVDQEVLDGLREALEANQLPLAIAIPIYLIFFPIGALITAFLSSGMYHICLMILGGANRDFEATFRAVCYGSGSIQILALVPCCGWLASAIWGIVVLIIALREIHETDTWRAVLTVFLPMMLCCCAVGAIFMAITAMIGGIAAGG
jgi:hypothetical protein